MARSIGGCSAAGPYHRGVQKFVEDLNKLCVAEPGLWQADYDLAGFYWIDCTDSVQQHSLVHAAIAGRRGTNCRGDEFTPVPRTGYRIGLPSPGKWREVLNSDAGIYGGSNMGNLGGVLSEEHKMHGQPYSAALTLPPLGVVAFQLEAALLLSGPALWCLLPGR